jgi:PIN domain nuclease of toxin-antitoxin system
MIAGVADTHTTIWYLFNDDRFSIASGDFIDQAAAGGDGIAISSISLAEIVYLIEKARIAANVYPELKAALADPEHVFKEAVLSSEVVDAMRQVPRDAVPDMPDRIVAATAVYSGVPVISRDGQIRASSVKAIGSVVDYQFVNQHPMRDDVVRCHASAPWPRFQESSWRPPIALEQRTRTKVRRVCRQRQQTLRVLGKVAKHLAAVFVDLFRGRSWAILGPHAIAGFKRLAGWLLFRRCG